MEKCAEQYGYLKLKMKIDSHSFDDEADVNFLPKWSMKYSADESDKQCLEIPVSTWSYRIFEKTEIKTVRS